MGRECKSWSSARPDGEDEEEVRGSDTERSCGERSKVPSRQEQEQLWDKDELYDCPLGQYSGDQRRAWEE